jgi:hypothetical protein
MANVLCRHSLSSYVLSKVWANSKGSLPQGQHLCDIQRNCRNYIQLHSVLDMKAWLKQNCSIRFLNEHG